MTPSPSPLRPLDGRWILRINGAILGESTRVLAHGADAAPIIFVPKDDIAMAFLDARAETDADGARYYDIIGKSRTLPKAAWEYPTRDGLRDHLTFDPRQVLLEQA